MTIEFLDYGLNDQEAVEIARYLIEDFDADGNGQLSLNELIVSWGGESGDQNPGDDNPSDPIDPPTDPGDGGGELSEAELLALEELELYDSDGNGAMSMTELSDEFTSQGMSNGEATDFAQYLMDMYDGDQSSELEFPELVASWGGDESTGGADDSQSNPDEGDSWGDFDNDLWGNDSNWWENDFDFAF